MVIRISELAHPNFFLVPQRIFRNIVQYFWLQTWMPGFFLRALPLSMERRLRILFLGVVLLPLLHAAPQQASAELKTLSLEELSQIEVTTPSKSPVRAFETPAAIYVITGEDIRRSGATSIPEALRLAPGVEVARVDGNNWSIGIRGFGSSLTRSVLVLIDGRTVYTPLFAGTNWDVQNTMLEDVDRIEVIRGPGGTIWGPNAVNGVINIITKDTKDTQGMLVSAGGGNQEQGFLDFRYGGGNGSGLTYRIYGMGFSRGPEDHQTGPNFDDWREGQLGFRMDWRESPRDMFTLQGDIYDEVAGKATGGTSYTPPYSQTLVNNALLSGGNILGRWRRTFDEGNDIQVQFYYDRTDRLTPNYSEVRNTFDIDLLQRLRLPARQEVSWGLGARVDPVDDRVVISGLQFDPNKRTDFLLTAFIQDEIALVDRHLSLTLGTKLLRTNFTTGVSFEPSARLLWSISERQSIWLAFTHALRTPSDSEEDFFLLGYQGTVNGIPHFARFNPNPEFAPEQMNGTEVGYRTLLGKKLFVDVTGFYNRYHDLFSEDIIGVPFLEATPAPAHFLLPAQFANGLYGYTKGAEIAPEWRPRDFWRLRGSYSYLHMNLGRSPNSQDVGSAPSIVGSSPQHQATIQSAFDISKRLQLDLTYRYVGALPQQGVAAYSTGDARIGFILSRQLDFSIVGQNLFQPSHFEYGGDPFGLVGIKRSVYAKLTWRR
jgi:iron complex outermembrane receptor protein